MATDGRARPTRNLTSAQPDKPVFRDAAQETADRAILAGEPQDHTLSNHVAAVTETPEEAAIDAANGLRGHGGRAPQPEDFAGLLTPAGDSGDVVGTEVTGGSPFAPLGNDPVMGGTIQDE